MGKGMCSMQGTQFQKIRIIENAFSYNFNSRDRKLELLGSTSMLLSEF